MPHVPWTDEAVRKWRADAAELPLPIFELGVGSVQRPGDLVGFRWGDFDGKNLSLRQNKTDKPLSLPCTHQLIAALERSKAGLGFIPLPTRYILTKQQGRSDDL